MKYNQSIIKRLSAKKKKDDPRQFIMDFHQIRKKNLTTIFLNLFYKIKTEGTLANSFYQVIVALISKPHKDPTKKENYRTVVLMNINAKFLNKILKN